MFMKTIAVGPFDEVASCVTGGTIVAIDLTWLSVLYSCGGRRHVVGAAATLGQTTREARFDTCRRGFRSAIAMPRHSDVMQGWKV